MHECACEHGPVASSTRPLPVSEPPRRRARPGGEARRLQPAGRRRERQDTRPPERGARGPPGVTGSGLGAQRGGGGSSRGLVRAPRTDTRPGSPAQGASTPRTAGRRGASRGEARVGARGRGSAGPARGSRLGSRGRGRGPGVRGASPGVAAGVWGSAGRAQGSAGPGRRSRPRSGGPQGQPWGRGRGLGFNGVKPGEHGRGSGVCGESPGVAAGVRGSAGPAQGTRPGSGGLRGEPEDPSDSLSAAAVVRLTRPGPDLTFTRSRRPPSPRPAPRMGGAGLPPCLGARRAEEAGRQRPRSQWARRTGAWGGTRRQSRQPTGPQGAGRGGAWARAAAYERGGRRRGRGVGTLAAARWPPRPFGPGGGRAEPAAPTPRFSASPLRCPPAAPRAPPP